MRAYFMAKKVKHARMSFEEREELILEAAGRLFSERGFRGTTTKDIANEAGVNEALIFKHCKSKEDLYTAALQHVLNRKGARFLPELEAVIGLPLEPALIKLASLIVRENRRHPDLMRMLLFSGLESHKLARKFLNQSLPLFDWMEGFFARKRLTGEISCGDPKMLTRFFMNVTCQYVLNVEIIGAKNFYQQPESAVLKSFVKTFVNGVSG